MYVDGEQVMPYNEKYPILLIKLRPTDRFKCYMKAVLAVAERHIIWSSVKNAYYSYSEQFVKFSEFDDVLENLKNNKEIKKKEYVDEENTYYFTVEGTQQCNEHEILIRGCKYLIKKVGDLKNDLENRIKTKAIFPEKIIHFYLENEDHTLGEILNYEFQDNPQIIRSGVIKPDHLVRAILIKIESVPDVSTPLDAMISSMNLLIKKLNHLGKVIYDLNNKDVKKTKK